MRTVSRALKGIAVFYVGKDEKVVKIDLQVSGLGPLRPSSRYSRYFRLLDDFALNIGIGKGLLKEDGVCYFSSKPVLCRLYRDPVTWRIEYVVLAAFQPGLIARLTGKLEENYWKRVFLLDIASARHPSAFKGWH